MKGKTKRSKRKTKENEKNVKKFSFEQVKESYLTGTKAITEAKGNYRKLAKVSILAFCSIGFIYQTFLFLNLYWLYPTRTVISNMKHMTKPAMTICDKNLISRRKFCENVPEECFDYTNSVRKQTNGLKRFCTAFLPFCQNPNDIYLKTPKFLTVGLKKEYYDLNFVKENGFQIEDCLVLCGWNNISLFRNTEKYTQCGKPAFLRALTEEKFPGACYTLYFDRNIDKHNVEELNPNTTFHIILRWRNSDLVNVGPKIHARTDVEPRIYYISFHHPSKLSNPFREGITVRDCRIYKVKVSQVDNIRLPPPFSSNCFDYEGEWRKNNGKGPLTKEECEQNCYIEEELKTYGCVSLRVSQPHLEKICTNNIPYDPEIQFKIETCQSKCRDACFESRYLATANFFSSVSVEQSLKLFNASSVVRLEISFDISSSKEHEEMPKFEAIEVFSYIGSYLSLWLGWSLIAVVDFVDIIRRLGLLLLRQKKCNN